MVSVTASRRFSSFHQSGGASPDTSSPWNPFVCVTFAASAFHAAVTSSLKTYCTDSSES